LWFDLDTSSTSAATDDIPTNASVAQIASDTSHYVTIGTGTPTAAATNSAAQWANSPLWLRLRTGSRGALKIAARTIA
jgi:hypothetical protein